jgi:simple sugar transport system ATP-binding protein
MTSPPTSSARAPASAATNSAALRLHGISKRFGQVVALEAVSLEFAPGRVHGLLGENGAGKSTLMHVLYGMVPPDQGTIAIGERTLRLATPRAARRAGIGMVHQHFALVPALSVIDNLALALGPTPGADGVGRVDRGAWRARLAAAAAELRWSIDGDARVGDLAVGTQQRLEILKALIGVSPASATAPSATAAPAAEAAARILILDEPTAVLTPQEVDDLLPALRTLAASGMIVILIGHKLGEIQRACDDIAILRRGRLVHQGPSAELTRERIAALMVGEKAGEQVGEKAGGNSGGNLAGISAENPREKSAPATQAAAQTPRLAIRGLVGPGKRPSYGPCDLQVAPGEIVGIAGVDGNGQGPLVAAILGVESPENGEISVDGAPSGPGRAADFGVIPDDRRRDALILPMTAADNLMLKDRRRDPFTVHGWLRPARWRAHARALMASHDVRGLPARPVRELSGGNQQKLVLARELAHDPGVIIAVNPTRGLDLRATAAVLSRLRQARAGGAGILLVHSDLDELLAISDRVLVMVGGKLSDSGWPACDRAAIGRMMLGLPVDAANMAQVRAEKP